MYKLKWQYKAKLLGLHSGKRFKFGNLPGFKVIYRLVLQIQLAIPVTLGNTGKYPPDFLLAAYLCFDLFVIKVNADVIVVAAGAYRPLAYHHKLFDYLIGVRLTVLGYLQNPDSAPYSLKSQLGLKLSGYGPAEFHQLPGVIVVCNQIGKLRLVYFKQHAVFVAFLFKQAGDPLGQILSVLKPVCNIQRLYGAEVYSHKRPPLGRGPLLKPGYKVVPPVKAGQAVMLIVIPELVFHLLSV